MSNAERMNSKNLGLAGIVFIIIYISRLIFIKLYAVDVPWSDQWDQEIELIYFKIIDGSISLADFWAQANEHRIVLTKLLNIVAYKLSGDQFNQVNALYLQAIIYALIPAFLVYFINKEELSFKKTFIVLAIFFPVIDWENLYWSYQSQVYFSIVFSFLGITLCSKEKIPTLSLILVIVLAGLSNGAAFYIPFLAAISSVLFGLKEPKRILLFRNFTLWLLVCFICYKVFSVPTPWHDKYKVNSFELFFNASKDFLSWPRGFGYILILVMIYKAAQVLKRMIFDKIEPSQKEKIGILLTIWFMIFLLSAIYTRAGLREIPNRYYIYYLLGFSSLFFYKYHLSTGTKVIAFTVVSFFLIDKSILHFNDWIKFSDMKKRHQENFIETLKMVKANPQITKEMVLENIKKVEIPYCGFPIYTYEKPTEILYDKRSLILFKYLIE